MGFDFKYGKVITEHGDIPDDEIVVVFRARDCHLPDVMKHYAELCEPASPERHVAMSRSTRDGIIAWQEDHPDRVRVPDSVRSLEWLPE